MVTERESMTLNEVGARALGVEERSDEAPRARASGAKPAPDPEVVAKPKRRQFTAEYRLRILEEADRCDLFSALDLVFFDTTSLFFTSNGGDTLGQYGKSKDHRSDCKQMVLGMVIDGDGIPVCSEMWPGNTTDVTTLDQVARTPAKSLRGASGMSGRRRRNDLEEDDCGGRGARLVLHSRRAGATDQGGSRRGAERHWRVRDGRGRASASRPDGASSQGSHGQRHTVQGGREGTTQATSLCGVPQSGPGPQGTQCGSDCPTPCVRSTLRRRSLTQVPEHRRFESRRTCGFQGKVITDSI